MTVGAIDPDAHLKGWPEVIEEVPAELPEPVWTRAPERTPKPKKKTTRKERRRK